MTSPGDASDVLDQRERSRFAVEEAGATAELTYLRDGKRLVLVHTGVPEALGGRGIGSRLVRAAVEAAAADGMTLVPWCPFARRWLEEHPEAAAAASVDWSLGGR